MRVRFSIATCLVVLTLCGVGFGILRWQAENAHLESLKREYGQRLCMVNIPDPSQPTKLKGRLVPTGPRHVTPPHATLTLSPNYRVIARTVKTPVTGERNPSRQFTRTDYEVLAVTNQGNQLLWSVNVLGFNGLFPGDGISFVLAARDDKTVAVAFQDHAIDTANRTSYYFAEISLNPRNNYEQVAVKTPDGAFDVPKPKYEVFSSDRLGFIDIAPTIKRLRWKDGTWYMDVECKYPTYKFPKGYRCSFVRDPETRKWSLSETDWSASKSDQPGA